MNESRLWRVLLLFATITTLLNRSVYADEASVIPFQDIVGQHCRKQEDCGVLPGLACVEKYEHVYILLSNGCMWIDLCIMTNAARVITVHGIYNADTKDDDVVMCIKRKRM